MQLSIADELVKSTGFQSPINRIFAESVFNG